MPTRSSRKSLIRGSKTSSKRIAPNPTEISNKKSSSIRHLMQKKSTPFVAKNEIVKEEEKSISIATKSWVIRVACGQIVRALDDVQATLSHPLLQELCAELVVRSSLVIQNKVVASNKSSNEEENNDVHLSPSKKIALSLLPNDGAALPVDNHRMAEMVENKNMRHSRRLSALKARGEDPFVSDNDGAQSYHALNNYLSDNQRQDYLAFKRADTNVPFILFFYLSALFFVITGFFWSSNTVLYQEHPTAAISIIFSFLAAISLFWTSLNHVVSLSAKYKHDYFQWYYRYVVKLYKSSYGQWPDNCACLFAALASGFYLVNIVIMDLCHTTTDISNDIVCLPTSVPPEAIIVTMLTVIMVQIAARGVSHLALVCSWIICVVAINFSIYLSENSNYVWINLLLILIMGMSYEWERQPHRQFNKMAGAMEVVKVAAELQLQYSNYKILLASEALESKRSLVRHIGHEIRTPLNVVGVGADMLLKELEPHAAVLPDGVMEIIEGIQEASSASLEVINELLEFEKLAAGMTTLECVPTPILPFLEQAMKQHMLSARSKEIRFELVPSVVTRNVTVNVDPCKLTTVFKNIFSNAIKFTKHHGRVTIRVDIKRSSPEDMEMLEIAVVDSGAGLSPGNLLRLFGEGVQFNANGLQGGGGSGLGLFITKGIVKLHENAKVWAESEGEGKGCTFFVRFPVHSHCALDVPAREKSNVDSIDLLTSLVVDPIHEFAPIDSSSDSCQLALAAESLIQHVSGKDSGKGSPPKVPSPLVVPVVAVWKPTIMVVDDSSMNRKMLVRSLVSKGFACCEAEDGLEALSEMSRSSNQATRKFVAPFPSFMSSKRPSIVSHASVAGGGGVVSSHSPGPPVLSLSTVGRQKLIGAACTNKLVASQIQHYSIDAVLIDYNMPKMNGPECIVELRNMGFVGPIIGVSGGDEKTMKQFIAAGADNVVQKPAKTDMLVEILLTGLEMMVVFDETQQRKKPTPVSSSTRDKERDSSVHDIEIVRQEHMDQLLIFLTETKAKAPVILTPVIAPVLVPSP